MTQALRLTGALLLAGFVAVPTSSQAQVRDIRIEHFDSRIEVNRDASIDVTETLRINFEGSWNGIERDIFLDHETGTGRITRLRFELRSVTDGAGAQLRVEDEGIAQGRRLRIWVPGAVDATRTVVIRYHVPDAIRFFEAAHPTGLHDELYWDVTGNEWEMPIGRVTAVVSLPAGAENVESWAYTGRTGSVRQDARIETIANEVRFEALGGFAPREGLTVSVSFAPGVVERPGAAAKLWEQLRRWWPLGLPFLALFLMHGVWSREGRDPVARAISVQYEPPPGLAAAEVGTLVDHQAEMHDITSMLVDLAVRGYVTIEERDVKKLLVFSDTEYWFHMKRPRASWSELEPFERTFLTALFSLANPGSGKLASVKLSDLENRFYRHLGGIRDGIYKSLIRKGMYGKRPDSVRNKWLIVAFLTLVPAFMGTGILAARSWLGDPVTFAMGIGLSALIVAGFALVMPTRTEAGARAREAALGFREFLSRVEQDRFRRMITSPELFERYLAHAMAFRVEARWAKAFEDLYRTPPDWYQGRPGTPFRTTQLARSINTLSAQAGRSMSSSPSSSGSSSSGSGGGGFSGGGSGGGGGRGF